MKLKQEIPNHVRNILTVYSSWADELRSKYERVSRLFPHAGNVGRSREAYLADVIRRVLRSPLKVTSGAILNPEKGHSQEQDILIIDPSVCSPIEEVAGFGIYYPDSFTGVVEVKSSLSSTELKKAIKGVASVVNLCFSTGGHSAIFGYRGTTSLKTVKNLLREKECRIDTIYSLDKYLIYENPKGRGYYVYKHNGKSIDGIDFCFIQFLSLFPKLKCPRFYADDWQWKNLEIHNFIEPEEIWEIPIP